MRRGRALWLLLLVAGCAQFHTSADDTRLYSAKIPAALEDKIRAGAATEALIELVPETTSAASGNLGSSEQGLAQTPGDLPPLAAVVVVDEDVAARALYYHEAQAAIVDAVASADVTLLTRYENLPFLFVRVHNLRGLYALAARGEVLRLHEERLIEHSASTSLPLIQQPAVAASGKTGAGTAVAVIDTGCDWKRSDFGSCTQPGASGCKVAYAADFAKDDLALDDSGHGTNVSAIVLSVAPSAQVLALDVFAGATAPSSAILAALDWTIKNRTTYNIVALNLSLGSGEYSAVCSADLFASALANVRAAGMLPTVASGNSGYSNALASPACVPAALSVGAVYDSNLGGVAYSACKDAATSADKITCFSNSAPFLSLLAPGAAVTAGGYRMTGTSQAAPHVAGAYAVMRAAYPNEPMNTTVARLTDSGPNIVDPRNNVTKHRLDVLAALNAAGSADKTAPTGNVSIQGNAAATNTVAVTLTIAGNDNVGVTSMCVANTNTCSVFEKFATNKTWTLSSGDGNKTVYVVLKDAAGNQVSISDSIRLDTTAPTGGTLRATPGDKRVQLTWTAASDAGGVASYRLMVAVNADPSCMIGTMVYSGTALTFTHSALQNGTAYGYRLCPSDGAGNVGVGSGVAARPAPEFNAPTGSVIIGGARPYISSPSVTLTIAATDPSGVASMCISNSSSCTQWETYATRKAWTLATTNGTATVNVWFKDTFGNASAAPVQASVKVDAQPPTAGLLTTTAQTTNAVSLSWTNASDPNGIESYKLVFAPGSTAPVNCSTGALLYTGLLLSYNHKGLASGSPYSYRLCATDNAGNPNSGVTRTVNTR
ncbi:MAG: hypothetical protein RL701_3958 [Pseudomonadota bacterium]